MADRDYNFSVYAATLQPFGPAWKENLDVTRLSYDFSCWLENGETISSVDFPTIIALPYGSATTNWRQDYPLDATTVCGVPPPDTYPLKSLSEAITNNSSVVEVKAVAGTPGYSYVLSFLVTGQTTGRRKQIDTIVSIEPLVNNKMAGPGPIPDTGSGPLIISGTTALPMGFAGWVYLENSANADGIVVTLPPNPSPGQTVGFIDVLGTDAAHPVTFYADSNGKLDGDGSTAFVSTVSYDVLEWAWTGANWHLMSDRYSFLG